MKHKIDYDTDREHKIHRSPKLKTSRIDKHKNTIYTLAASYKKRAVDLDDDLDEAILYYDTFTKRR
jgi:hypothetical protein